MKRIVSVLILICLLFSACTLIGCKKKGITEPDGHHMSVWQLEEQATYKKKGSLVRYCLDENCDYSQRYSVKAASGLEYSEEDGKTVVSGVGDFNGEFLYIAATDKAGDKVDAIGFEAFSDNKHIKHIYIEEGITLVDGYAFSGCTALISANLPESVTTADVGLFMGCERLTAVHLPDGLTAVPQGCFNNCVALEHVNIPKSAELIASTAFNLCSSLTEVTFPAGLKRIEANAFADCAKLTAPVFPEGLEVIGFSAFACCNAFENIVLPENLEALYDCAFSACRGLKSVFIPASVKEIYAPEGISPFVYCSSDLLLSTDAAARQNGWGEYFAVYDSISDTAPETYQYLKVIYNAEG